MTPERWKQIEEVFQVAIDLPASERAQYIATCCAGDDELNAQVAALIAQHDAAGEFIEAPAFAVTDLRHLTQTPTTTPPTGAFVDPTIGRRVGAYQIVREIGRGGMGAVYLAERADGEFRQRVAIKLIKRGMDTDFILRRFRHERQILATLDHPNIARLLDGGTTTDGLPFFVMEHIEGLPVYRYCDEHKLPIAERLRLFSQICEAVHYAHRNLVIHRDIKPSNILVTSEGVPKLLDFGIAKMLNPDLIGDITHDPTATAMRLMTPEYASPEQAQGQTVTPTTDVYSLGVLLYELLTGHRPYRLRNRAPHEIARIICEEEPVPLSAVISRPDDLLPTYPMNEETTTLNYLYWSRRANVESLRRALSGDLENVVMKALRKEPTQRYQSVEHLREDIARYLEGRPVSAPPFIATLLKPPPGERAHTDELSVAVLPFGLLDAPAADDTGDEYLGVGLADALITRLSNVRRLVVRPTSSVMQYGAMDEPLVAGQRLAVNFIVSGEIKRVDETLRVTVQLFSVAEGATRWAAGFDQKLTDVLQLEDLLSEQIAGMLIPQLTGEERQQLAKRGTDNAEAFEAYLRGRYHFHSLTEEGFAKALVDYHRAIALDPDYALAYAGIADYYIFLGIYGIMPFAESSAAAKEAAQRAVALDDMLAEAYAALGFATVCRDFDWRTAEEHHRRALELNPNSPTAHNWYSFNLLQQARFDEARAEVDRVLALDPMSPLGITSLAWCHYHARRFDEALAAYRKLIEAEPRFGYGRLVYSWALRCAGRYEEAVTQAAKAVELAGDGQLYLTGLGAAYAAAGRNDDARSMLTLLRELARTRYVSPYCLALIYCYLGDKEQALALLEEAVAIDDAWVTWLVVDPQLDVLRGDPRFLTLAERTNNPAAALAATGLATGDKSIAILPLKVLTPARADDTSDEYLGLGLADALITRLSRVQQLIVRPANSVLRYQGGDADPIQAGRELQVNYVVSGNIRRVGDRIRVSAQLLSVQESATRWAGKFDERAADVLQLEDSISKQLAGALVPHLTGDERQQLSKRGTDDPEAYEAYLRGRYYWTSMSATGFGKAMSCFQRAIELDPAYAAAYSGIAEYHCWQAIYGLMPPAESLAAARAAARRAVELDETRAEAHAAQGLALLTHQTQWQAASAAFLRAIELNPNYATARSNYACQLAMEGRFDESIIEARRARALDPLNPFNAYILAWCLYQARRYDENVAESRRLIQSEPSFGSAYFTLSWTLRRIGAHAEAVTTAEQATELIGGIPMLRAALGAAYAEAGQHAEARRVLAELSAQAGAQFVTPYHRALVHLYLGEREEALALLEESVAASDPWIVWLGVEPQLDPLRDEPRFAALLRRTGQPFDVRTNGRPSQPAPAPPVAAAPVVPAGRPTHDSGALHAASASAQGTRHTEDEEANQLYVAGRYYATRRTAEGLRQGIERLERAVARAPQFALAYAELADCYALLNWYVEPPPAEAWARAKEAALHAVAADDKLAEAHASLGFVKLHYDRDWAGAEREFRRALELKPENAAAHRWYAFSLAAADRRAEAVAEIRRAQEISPQSPVIATAVANVLFLARRFDEAIAQCRRALELDPGSVAANVVLRWAYEAQGLHAEALAAFEQERIFAGDTPTTRAKHAHVLAACGRKAEARAILDDLLARRDEQWVTAYEIAIIFSLLDDRDRAFEWLAQAEREHAVGFTFVRVDPHLDNLRADPRFDAILRRTESTPA